MKAASLLESCTLLAADGAVGTIEQFYFGTRQWTIRYLVVNSGCPQAGWRLLISPVAIGDVRPGNREIEIELTRSQVRNSPAVNTHKPLTRRFEARYFDYYGWPAYWETGSSSGSPRPRRSIFGTRRAGNGATARQGDKDLRATTEIKGLAVEARDGFIGQAVDFIIDSRYWVIRYLDIETRGWWQQKHVLIHPGWIEDIDWAGGSARVALSCDALRQAPEFDTSGTIDRDYETRLFNCYGYPGYWQQG
jgi:hypothetical protein